MKMKKTQGQKRKGRIKAVMITLFCLLTAGGVGLYQKFISIEYAWVDRHQVAAGTVTSLDSEVDEYRNLKGRKRTTTYYYVEYSYEVDGELIDSFEEISRPLYQSLNEGGSIEILYDPEDPYLSGPAEVVENAASSSIEPALMTVAPITGGVCYFLFIVLNFLFGRESRTKLAEGFFTENSWLDVEDNKLVLIDGESLTIAKFDPDQKRSITESYQADASHSELLAIFKAKQIETVKTSDVSNVSSRHDDDTIIVTAGDESITLDFLNVGTKAHALEHLEKLLPSVLEKTTTQRSRIRAALPRLVVMSILAGVGITLGSGGIWFVIGLVMLIMMPKLVRRLVDPSIVTTFTSDENAVDANEVQQPAVVSSDEVVVAKAA